MTTTEEITVSLSKLKVGDSVKLNVNNKEKLWVQITEVNQSKFKGKIDTHPYVSEDIKMGDEVSFEKENICDVLFQE